MAAPEDTAALRYPGGELDLEIVHATEGSDGISMGPLLAKTGYTSYDPGFVNTASTKSADHSFDDLTVRSAWLSGISPSFVFCCAR